MLFQRLIWCALAAALLVGSVQWAGQRWQAVPLILAAEAFEAQKAELPHAHEHAHDGEGAQTATHHHDAAEWSPAEGAERTFWTWAANVLHAFSMALLLFAAMGAWVWKRGGATHPALLALAVAGAGWLSLHVWPALGLPAEVPGLEAAALGLRQAWWCLAAVCAALACAALAGVASKSIAGHWRLLAAGLLLALPFLVGAPVPPSDPLAGFDLVARTQLALLHQDFVWATHGLAVVFWLSLAGMGGWLFGRWLQPLIVSRPPVGAPLASVRGVP